MYDAWLETEHLTLDADGVLWRRIPADGAPLRRRLWELRGLRREQLRVRLGRIVDEATVPRALEGEMAELVDQWRDGLRYDERGEWEAAYRAGSGVFRSS